MQTKKPTDVEQYILSIPDYAQEKFRQFRSILKDVVPHAKEGLKWGKPVFESDTILFAYSAHRSHLSFIPTGPVLEAFQKELSEYVRGKDSVQFPYNKTFPEELIRKMARYRKEAVEKHGAKWKY